MTYTVEQYRTLSERFNKMSFLQKLITIKNNDTLMYIETDGYNIRLRFFDKGVMERGDDLLFFFPQFLEYSHLKGIFSLGNINVKELK